MAVVVHIDKFSGPLALLLHLIRKEEMDIFDINIHEITQQYLESIRAMRKLNLEVAGDFIAMAATLIQIKSKMLLPQYNEDGEVVETEDPRKDLVQRLLEYQAFQDAGGKLYERPLLNRDVWTRGMTENFEEKVEEDVVVEEDNALYALIRSYRQALKSMKKAVHRVAESLQSIAERIWEMRERLIVGRTAMYSELVQVGPGDKRGNVLITFLSLLELAKMGIVSLFQSENFADIHVEAKKSIDRESLSHVEDYEKTKPVDVTASAAAEVILDEADRQIDMFAEDSQESDANAASENTGAPITDEAGLPVAIVNEDGEVHPLMQAATDEEIEAEEAKYGLKEEPII